MEPVYRSAFKWPAWVKSIKADGFADRLLLKVPYNARKLSKALELLVLKNSIQIVETDNYTCLHLFYLWKENRPPFVTRVATTMRTLWGNESTKPFLGRKLICWIEKQALKSSDYLVTHTSAHCAEVCRQLHINPARFKIIPLGVKPPDAQEIMHSKDSKGKISVLYVGRFEPRKGIDVLLRAIPSILKRIPNISFILAGEDLDNRYKKEFLENNDLFDRDRVTFAGKVGYDSLREMYRCCDIVVAPSRYESFGLVYIEAMSYGKPVIGCSAGGVPEVIENGVTGLLVRPGDVDDLKEKIVQLAKDETLCEQMGKNARERVERLFSVDRMVAQTLKNYEEILSRASHPSARKR
jgi:glycosyltransferase involved in cell wall biosynthesis